MKPLACRCGCDIPCLILKVVFNMKEKPVMNLSCDETLSNETFSVMRFRTIGAWLACGLVFAACGGSKSSAPPPAETGNVAGRRAFLIAVANDVVLPLYREFDSAAGELERAAAAYASSLSESDRAGVQQAWRTAMALWQRGELYQFGPAGMKGQVAGGMDHRDNLYAWPLINRCRIDQMTLEESYNDAAALAAQPVNVRGLGALEYAQFVTGRANSCPATNAINTTGAWDAQTDAQIVERRARYAAAVAALLKQEAASLRADWEADQGNFVAALVTAGEGSKVYASTQAALNAVTDAAFYLDTETKSMKLAVPAGLNQCEQETCPGALESPLARVSKENMVENFRAFDALVRHPNGLSSLLRALNAESVAVNLEQALQQTLQAIEAVPGPLEEALSTDLTAVRGLYEVMKGVTTIMKTEFVSALDLELPARAEADND